MPFLFSLLLVCTHSCSVAGKRYHVLIKHSLYKIKIRIFLFQESSMANSYYTKFKSYPNIPLVQVFYLFTGVISEVKPKLKAEKDGCRSNCTKGWDSNLAVPNTLKNSAACEIEKKTAFFSASDLVQKLRSGNWNQPPPSIQNSSFKYGIANILIKTSFKELLTKLTDFKAHLALCGLGIQKC